MKKILIYRDEGADAFCLASLIASLKLEKIDQMYFLEWADRDLFRHMDWQNDTHLVIFPGGRDIPYHQALKGTANRNILRFVEEGGRFLGICAGGYYGSAKIEFEKGGLLEVVEDRELQFFPGMACGPAYGTGKFCYRSEKGAQIAALQLSNSSCLSGAYFNGGCAFVGAENYAGVSVMARYADIEGHPAAIVKCHVGKGCAILSGVHPEYSAYHECTKKQIKEPLFTALKQVEQERRSLFLNLLNSIF